MRGQCIDCERHTCDVWWFDDSYIGHGYTFLCKHCQEKRINAKWELDKARIQEIAGTIQGDAEKITAARTRPD